MQTSSLKIAPFPSSNLFWSLAGGSNILDGQSWGVAGKYAVRREHLRTNVWNTAQRHGQTEELSSLHRFSFKHRPIKHLFCETYSLHLLQHCMLDLNVFKHCFNNHVSPFKAAVIQLACQVRQKEVSLKWCDVLLFGLVIESSLKQNSLCELTFQFKHIYSKNRQMITWQSKGSQT